MLYEVIGVLIVLGFLIKWLLRQIQVIHFIKKHECKPVAKIPQSERIIGIGFTLKQLKAANKNQILELSLNRYRTYGNNWSVVMAGTTYINTIEPENVKTILATDFKSFGLGQRVEAWGALLGQGIFTTDGAQWEHSRALVRPNFSRAQVANLDEFEPHIQRLISKIPKNLSTIDLQPLFSQLTLDSATEFLFGQSVNSLTSPEGSENQLFCKAFDLAQSRMVNRMRMGKLVHIRPDPEFYEACRVVHRYVDKIVYDALARFQSRDLEKLIEGRGKHERYVFLTEMIKSTQDPKQLRDELLNILLAGRDTTASLLSNTFHVLARRPDIWKKVKSEVDQLNGAKPNYETLRNLTYVKNLLTESLRLYPVVPFNARFANKDTVLPTGGGPDGTAPIFVPRGGLAVWHTYAMHRRTDIYGPDALEFRPERWNAEEGLRPGWGYLPFNGGPRICVGQMFALTHAAYVVVRLAQEFEEMQDRDGTEWLEQLTLVMCSAKGVKVAMVPRTR